MTHCLTIRTAQHGFDAARRAAHEYAEQHSYRLGERDCVTMMGHMLNALRDATKGAEDELHVPEKEALETPPDFLERLLTANGLLLNDD